MISQPTTRRKPVFVHQVGYGKQKAVSAKPRNPVHKVITQIVTDPDQYILWPINEHWFKPTTDLSLKVEAGKTLISIVPRVGPARPWPLSGRRTHDDAPVAGSETQPSGLSNG